MSEEMTAVAPEVISSLVPDAPESPETQPETAEPEVQEPDKETPPVEDGRKIPPALREAFKADPRARDRWFKGGALLETFPEGPKQAQALIAEVESLTSQFGVETLPEVFTAIEQERGEWAALDEQYATGNPDFIKNIAETNPEAFSKLMPAALETLANMDGDSYNHLMARVVINTIQQPLAEVYELLAADEKTRPAADKLAKWYRGIEDLANKQPEKKVNAEAEKLQKDREAFEKQKAQEFHTQAENKMRDYNANLVESLLTKEFNRNGKNLAAEKKANPEAFSIMVDNCFNAIRQIVAKDQTMLKQYQALLASGDMDKATKFAQARIQKLAPEAVNKIFRVFNRNVATKRVTTPQTEPQRGNGHAIPLGRTPKEGEIDWDMMRAKGLDGSSGEVYLKGRKELYSF